MDYVGYEGANGVYKGYRCNLFDKFVVIVSTIRQMHGLRTSKYDVIRYMKMSGSSYMNRE